MDLPVSGVVEASISREEALAKFQEINWSIYTRSDASGITAEEVVVFQKTETLMQNDDPTDDKVDQYLAKYGVVLSRGLLNILKNVTEPKVVRYALARMQTLLPDGPRLRSRVQLFVVHDDDGCRVDAQIFLRVLQAEKGYIESAASHVLSKCLTIVSVSRDIEILMTWICQHLALGPKAENLSDATRSASARSAIEALMVLLRVRDARTVFVQHKGIALLTTILNHGSNRAQLNYEICFILWTLTYCEEALDQFSDGALQALIQKLVSSPREKIVRVILAALRNLLGKNGGIYDELMLESGVLKTLNQMKERKWTDQDIVQDLQKVREFLLREFKVLSSMERYEKEIRTSKLHWGILHTDKFWQQNYMDFEKQDFEFIKALIQLLESPDTTTVAVALYDIGDFVRFYPNGKMIVKRLGAKSIVMRHLQHEDSTVRKHALQCVSKMMVNKWEFVK